MITYSWIIAVIPLLAFVLLLAFGNRMKERAAWIGVTALGLAFLMALKVLAEVLAGAQAAASFEWLKIGSYTIDMGFQVGALEASMMVVVTAVSLMVQIYSMGYMHGDPRFNRYYMTVNLFTTGMLGVVIADNFLLFLMSWEIMGLCSYLLISHYYEDLNNAKAGMKAFLTTRVGDVGMMAGIWLLFSQAGSFNFADIAVWVENASGSENIITLAALLLFAGAVGKSAQVPLHVWLPDAMAGPTPASALIHAATMVAAGVYLVAKSYFIFQASPDAMFVVAVIGALTAFLAATIATVQVDLKKVLAYSTVSQLGFMMLGLGVGGYTAALFHLITHAFFKALLFLGAGSVIHAVHTQNMHEMGGLFKKMKITGTTFIIGSLALAGIPPFAGFYSKDMILLEAYRYNEVLFWIGAAAAFMTAYYMTRAIILTFFGKPRDMEKYEHAHESPLNMSIPLMFLAIPATLLGYGMYRDYFVKSFITLPGLTHAYHSDFVMNMAISVAVLGIIVGFIVYGTNWVSKTAAIRNLKPLYVLLKHKYYFDELYNGVVVKGTVGISRLVGWFDKWIVDGLVNFVGWSTGQLSRLTRTFDTIVVDGAVNGTAALTMAAGNQVRKLQTGVVQSYMLVLFAGVVIGLIIFQLIGG